MVKKILIIAGGGIKHLDPFKTEAEKFGMDVVVDSLSNLEYLVEEGKAFQITVSGVPLEEFSLIYIRLVGKRQENAYLLVNYAKEKNIKVIDQMFFEKQPVNIPLTKSLETKFLVQKELPIAKTYFAKLKNIVKRGEKLIGFPLVLKETTSQKSKGVWIVKDQKQLEELVSSLKDDQKSGKVYLAQEFIEASQRIRVLVVGKKAIAALTRPMKWRSIFIEKSTEGIREPLNPIPEDDANLAVKAATSLEINIAGVDIIHEDKTGKAYVMEVNPAPRWDSVNKETGVNVEREILLFLKEQID